MHAEAQRPNVLRLAAPVALLLAVGAVVAGQLGLFTRTPPPPPQYAPWPVSIDPLATVQIGVVTQAMAANWAQPWTSGDLNQINTFEHLIRKHAEIVMYFADWAHTQFNLAQLKEIQARGSIPELAWEPWSADLGPYRGNHQPAYSLASIINGRHDAYIRSWARGLKQYGGTVLLRFAQEMNIRAYPWSERTNGNHAGQYIEAWRHVHDIFQAVGATNVRWVWAPSANYFSAVDYPGSSYVDVLALTGFNGGKVPNWGGWRSYSYIFSDALAKLHAIDPSKPVQIAEIGSAEQGGSKAAWLTAMFKDLGQTPFVRSIVWFDINKEADWRVNSSPAALRAFDRGIASYRFN